jgi:hypothetical protein
MSEQTGSPTDKRDPLAEAYLGPDRRFFTELFDRSTLLFLHLPPGQEGGLDPKITKDEFLAHVRSAAQDLAARKQFNPFCRLRETGRSLLLFTGRPFAQVFAHAYVREVKRIMPFQIVGVIASALASSFSRDYSVVLNARSEFEYELTAEDMRLIQEASARQPSGGEAEP